MTALSYQETQVCYKKTSTIVKSVLPTKIEDLTNIMTKISSAIDNKDLKKAILLINDILINYSELLDEKQMQDLKDTLSCLQGIFDVVKN